MGKQANNRKMDRDEIFKKVAKNAATTVLSFPDRGPWGDPAYRGNCSGWIPASIIYRYGCRSVSEIFAGGGTTSDLCKDLRVPYIGIDLNPEPLRDDIIPMDILNMEEELPDLFYSADLQFLHPPYPCIRHIHYKNGMWKSGKETGKDIQEMAWDEGMAAVNKAILRGYAAMPKGSYQAVLVGDIRRKVNGKSEFLSMLSRIAIPGQLQQIIIKLQHNTASGRSGGYTGKKYPFFLIEHEFVVVTKKPSGYEIAFTMPRHYAVDIRDSKISATWKDVVAAALAHLGREARLDDIYREVEGHKKCGANPHWKDKVRQTLQKHGMFKNVSRGVWAMAA